MWIVTIRDILVKMSISTSRNESEKYNLSFVYPCQGSSYTNCNFFQNELKFYYIKVTTRFTVLLKRNDFELLEKLKRSLTYIHSLTSKSKDENCINHFICDFINHSDLIIFLKYVSMFYNLFLIKAV